jgi:hypothetical protein
VDERAPTALPHHRWRDFVRGCDFIRERRADAADDVGPRDKIVVIGLAGRTGPGRRAQLCRRGEICRSLWTGAGSSVIKAVLLL